MVLSVSMGGHFSAFLESRSNQLPGEYGYESARSSLYLLLKTQRPKRVFVPNYICDAVTAAVDASGSELKRYSIDGRFEPTERVPLLRDDYIVLVNYFGICDQAIGNALKRIPAEQVIIDCSQAYFFDDRKPTSKIYSPRKFIPVADGGFVSTKIRLRQTDADEHASIRRYQYLLERTIAEPELSREHYLQSEKDLESISDRSISFFTKKICETVDLQFIKQRRRENFKILQSLDSINRLKFELGDQVPLCYPLMLENADELREQLVQLRIFTPKYWPRITPSNSFEASLLQKTVFLPIDHRHNTEQMFFLLNTLERLL